MCNNHSHANTDNEPPWFVGTMEREKAEQFLMEVRVTAVQYRYAISMLFASLQNGRQREFLIRERTARRGYYALSIRYHYR